MSALPLADVATERALEAPLRPQGDHAPARTPLALVRPATRRRRRWPFVMMCVMVVAAVVGTVLVLNVSVSRTQYQLVALRAEQQAVAQENGALTEEINNKRAPQNLAKEAKAEAMVPGGQPGVVDLTKGSVTAQAAPAAADADAKKAAKEEALNVATPLTPAERAAAVAKKQEQANAAKAAATEAANAKASGASSGASSTAAGENGTTGAGTSTGTDASSSAQSGSTSSKTESASGDAAKDSTTGFTKKQLNGGTIPAPSN